MAARVFSLVFGLLYLAIGILSFVPALLYPAPNRIEHQHLAVSLYYAYLFGWLPVNVVHNIVYILIGIAGILAARSLMAAWSFAKFLFGVAAVFVYLGILPWSFNDLWGFLPLFDWNVPLHLLTALLAWYFGFVYTHGMKPAEPVLA